MKLLRITELMELTGFTRPTLTKLIKKIADKGSSNTLYNQSLRLYGVRDLDTFFKEINGVDFNNNDKGNEKCKKDYIKEAIPTGFAIQEMENNISNQLRKMIYKGQ